MTADAAGYDAELMDAEIIVDRTTTLRSFTIDDLIAYFGRSRSWIYQRVGRGEFPQPQWPAETPKEKARWSRQQVIEVLARRLDEEEGEASLSPESRRFTQVGGVVVPRETGAT